MKRLKYLVFSACLLVLIIVVVAFSSAAQKYTIIEGGTLIDGTGENPIVDSLIVIEQDRIITVSRKGEINCESLLILSKSSFLLTFNFADFSSGGISERLKTRASAGN